MNVEEQHQGRDGGRPVDHEERGGELADLLSDRYTREAIAHLRTASGPVDVSDLSREVAAAVRDESPEEVPDEVERRIQTVLHMGHLPSLADHGVVEFDPEAGRVRLVEDVVG